MTAVVDAPPKRGTVTQSLVSRYGEIFDRKTGFMTKYNVEREEQIELLRLLWTQRSVTFRGRWHTVEAAGLNPRPLQQPVPIWLGG